MMNIKVIILFSSFNLQIIFQISQQSLKKHIPKKRSNRPPIFEIKSNIYNTNIEKYYTIVNFLLVIIIINRANIYLIISVSD